MKDAQDVIMGLWASGYAATDIIQTLFKVYTVAIILLYHWHGQHSRSLLVHCSLFLGQCVLFAYAYG